MTTNLTLADRELVQALRAEGLTLSEISRLLGLSAPEVEYDQPGSGTDRRGQLVDWFMVH